METARLHAGPTPQPDQRGNAKARAGIMPTPEKRERDTGEDDAYTLPSVMEATL